MKAVWLDRWIGGRATFCPKCGAKCAKSWKKEKCPLQPSQLQRAFFIIKTTRPCAVTAGVAARS